MTTQQLIDYSKAYTFKIKDYQKTFDKYKDYKTDKRNTIKEDLSIQNNLASNAIYEIYSGYSYAKNLTKDLSCKSNIRRIATCINQYTSLQIKNYIEYMTDWLNDNEIKSFTIRYYLENYNAINNQMSEELVWLVEIYTDNTK